MRAWLRLLAGVAALTGAAFGLRFLLDETAERPWLLAANPDAAPVALDAFVVGLTDFSMPAFAVLFVVWALGYQLTARGWVAPRLLRAVYPAIGLVVGGVCCVRLLEKYALDSPVYGLAAVSVLGFAAVSQSFGRLDADTQARLWRAFLWTLVAIALTQIAVKLLVEGAPYRVRPLHRDNEAWNHLLRRLADEDPKRGTGYPSGHAASLFALLTPLFWSLRHAGRRALLLAWATLHSATRLYVGAHYPSDALVGSVLGFGTGTLVAFLLPGLVYGMPSTVAAGSDASSDAASGTPKASAASSSSTRASPR